MVGGEEDWGGLGGKHIEGACMDTSPLLIVSERGHGVGGEGCVVVKTTQTWTWT